MFPPFFFLFFAVTIKTKEVVGGALFFFFFFLGAAAEYCNTPPRLASPDNMWQYCLGIYHSRDYQVIRASPKPQPHRVVGGELYYYTIVDCPWEEIPSPAEADMCISFTTLIEQISHQNTSHIRPSRRLHSHLISVIPTPTNI